MKNDNIVLVGFMGAGKTTMGRKLSQALDLPLLDTDKEIERREGKSVSAIFADEGEKAFRDKETALLRELASSPEKKVISCGGGIVVREENRELLKQLGTVVYLKVSPERVYSRLKRDKTRPLLRVEDPLAEIRRLLGAREAAYQDAATVIVDAGRGDKNTVFSEILQILENKA